MAIVVVTSNVHGIGVAEGLIWILAIVGLAYIAHHDISPLVSHGTSIVITKLISTIVSDRPGKK